MKRKIRLTESQLISLIERMVNESTKSAKPFDKAAPKGGDEILSKVGNSVPSGKPAAKKTPSGGSKPAAKRPGVAAPGTAKLASGKPQGGPAKSVTAKRQTEPKEINNPKNVGVGASKGQANKGVQRK